MRGCCLARAEIMRAPATSVPTASVNQSMIPVVDSAKSEAEAHVVGGSL